MADERSFAVTNSAWLETLIQRKDKIWKIGQTGNIYSQAFALRVQLEWCK